MNDNDALAAHKDNIEISLFLMRASVFLVMLVWTLDKFTDPGHGARILEGFYFIGGAGETVIMAMGAVELLLILAFLAGMWKKYTYGIVLLLHSLTTFSSFPQYLDMNLLFFAAWAMFAACVALFLLRDLDQKFTLSK